MMRYIFFGSSEFSCIILERLCQQSISPSLIITQPPKKKGRGLKELPTEVGLFAKENNLTLLTPENLNNGELIEKIRKFEPHLFIVVDYGKKIPKNLLLIPKILPLGIHPSILPKYRGPAPINWAIINGEKYSGVTIFKITEKIDSGQIILQKAIEILDTDDAISLKNKLAFLAVDLLLETLNNIKTNNFKLTPQDQNLATFAPKLKKEDGKINWDNEAKCIFNLIRGLKGWPSAYTYFHQTMIKVLEAEVCEQKVLQPPATIVKIDKTGIYVSTKKGILKIKKLQPQNKKNMDAYAFVIGHKVKVGDKFL
ncbi:MAG: methionyl-tRNA formyltransferase [Candidatus Omnitrophica bacterium]|nr:methionyl-tRNA formyltransferase [Candidatus Omnitrophota bacterium]